MTGQELLKRYPKKKDDYSQVLMTALYVDADRVYELLERADIEGKKLVIEYSISPDQGPSEPVVAIK